MAVKVVAPQNSKMMWNQHMAVNVEEKQENIENNAQLLKYLEKSNGILKKFYTVLKK